MMMMIPPIVGVPFLLICPSSPRLRTVSPIWRYCKRSMMRRPMAVAMKSERMSASPERNDTYLNMPAPGKSNWSK